MMAVMEGMLASFTIPVFVCLSPTRLLDLHVPAVCGPAFSAIQYSGQDYGFVDQNLCPGLEIVLFNDSLSQSRERPTRTTEAVLYSLFSVCLVEL